MKLISSHVSQIFSKIGELTDLGVKAGIIEKSGSWFSYGSERIGQGRENAKNYMKENPEVAATIEEKIRRESGLIEEDMPVESEEILRSDGENTSEKMVEKPLEENF